MSHNKKGHAVIIEYRVASAAVYADDSHFYRLVVGDLGQQENVLDANFRTMGRNELVSRKFDLLCVCFPQMVRAFFQSVSESSDRYTSEGRNERPVIVDVFAVP